MSNLSLLVDSPLIDLQLVADGVLVGALFALPAFGMALVWGVMGVINIAQGELVMLGGYVAVGLARHGVPPLATLPLCAAASALLGWIMYRVVVHRVVDNDLFTSLLATFGCSIVLQQLANQIFGADVQTAATDLGTLSLFDGAVSVAMVKLVAFGGALVLGAVLLAFLRSTRLGRAIRATAQNARAARVLGIDTDAVYAATFTLNAAICGAAGGLVAMTWVIHPYIGMSYTVRSFMVVVVAGLGNLAGIVASGALLGVFENFAGFLLGAEFQGAFVFTLLVAVLVVRNQILARQRRYLK